MESRFGADTVPTAWPVSADARQSAYNTNTPAESAAVTGSADSLFGFYLTSLIKYSRIAAASTA